MWVLSLSLRLKVSKIKSQTFSIYKLLSSYIDEKKIELCITSLHRDMDFNSVVSVDGRKFEVAKWLGLLVFSLLLYCPIISALG